MNKGIKSEAEVCFEAEKKLVESAARYKEVRVLLGQLLEESHFLAPSISPDNPSDTHAAAFREGQRFFGQRIFELLMSLSDAKPLSCMREAKRWRDQVQTEVNEMKRKAALEAEKALQEEYQ